MVWWRCVCGLFIPYFLLICTVCVFARVKQLHYIIRQKAFVHTIKVTDTITDNCTFCTTLHYTCKWPEVVATCACNVCTWQYMCVAVTCGWNVINMCTGHVCALYLNCNCSEQRCLHVHTHTKLTLWLKQQWFSSGMVVSSVHMTPLFWFSPHHISLEHVPKEIRKENFKLKPKV